MNYYVYNPGGSDYGPFTIEQLRANLASRKYSPKTRVRPEGVKDWYVVSELLNDVPAQNELLSRHPPKDAQCYLFQNNQEEGPFLPEQIRSMWATGKITADTLYRFDGLEGWFPAKNFCAHAESHSQNPESFAIVVVFTVFLPIVGLIAGISWLCNPKYRGAGGAIIAISLVLIFIYTMLLVSFNH